MVNCGPRHTKKVSVLSYRKVKKIVADLRHDYLL
jgi:hypothetical protein